MDVFFTPDKLPLYVMAKPMGALCNLNCAYCYYLEKDKMYANRQNTQMSYALLEQYIKNYIESQPRPEVLFTWHGGEPLMRGIDFFEKAITLQRYYAQKRRIQVSNSLQTNGVLLNDKWCEFFAKNGFLIGISLDGPDHCHNRYRCNRAGEPSHDKVVKGIKLLQKHGVDFNILSVVNNYNVNYPAEVYAYFKSIGGNYIQFTPIVERIAVDKPDNDLQLVLPEYTNNSEIAEWSVAPLAYGKFLTTIFDEWVRNDVASCFVINFDATLANWMGVEPATCVYAPTCGHAMAMEHNGDVFACDHFVFPEYKRGNIWETSLLQMLYSPQQIQFGNDKRDKLPKQCLQCQYLFACNGECPKNRILTTREGEAGLNYFCEGFQHYFSHVAPYMDFMANELKNQRPPSNVMQWARNR